MQVAFYKGRVRFFNRFVAWYLRGPYSHCELVLGTDAAGLSECVSASYLDGGVRTKRMQLDPEHWDVVDVPGSTRWPRFWARVHAHDRYDILGLLGFVWRRQTGAQERWFCSEAVAAMLRMPDPWRYDPMTLCSALRWKCNLPEDMR